MSNNEKYAVYKKKDLDYLPAGLAPWDAGLDPLDDAVVIRTQDIFAASGLSTYRDNIRTYRDLLYAMDMESVEAQARQMLTVAQLDRIISYFNDVVQEAEDRNARGDARLPD